MAEPQTYKDNKEWGITDYYFIDLIVMLASSAKIDLGELPHPYYKDKELNLARARITINMISSLIKKTSGNLNIEERKVLRISALPPFYHRAHMITNLQQSNKFFFRSLHFHTASYVH